MDVHVQTFLIADRRWLLFLNNGFPNTCPTFLFNRLSILGLSESSYPYKGYIVVDISFPAILTGEAETISILALVCPEPQSTQQVPVIVGTNANFFQWLTTFSLDSSVSNQAYSLRIQSEVPKLHVPQIKGKVEVSDSDEG